MKKSILFFLSIVLTNIYTLASVVTGRVYNPSFDEGEPFATLRLYSANNPEKPVSTNLSDTDGYFEIEIQKPGDYKLEISALGKEVEIREIEVKGNDNVDLGNIELKDNTKELNEVVITAQRPLVQMTTDEMVYNVGADSDSKTYTLLEMLRKVPMVSVDGEDNITVNGSSNFQVYVDGKPSLLFSGNPSQIFKAMPASSVQNIEVITNPGARFDAEGTGGVINLIMNKESAANSQDIKAYNVTVNLRGGNRGVGGNIYATGQVGKFSASLNLIENYSILGKSEMATDRFEGNTSIYSLATSKPKIPFTMGSLNLNYDIDTLTSVGASFSLNRFDNHYTGVINTSIKQDSQEFLKYLEDSESKQNRQGLNGSINLSREFGRNRQHQLNLTYQISHENRNEFYSNQFDVLVPSDLIMDDRTSNSKMKTTEQIALLDFTSKFGNNKIVAGLKGTFRNAYADNSYLTDNIGGMDGSQNYKNINNIGAAYAEYSFNQALFGLRAGLRYEHTWQSIRYDNEIMSGYKNNYGNLVPSGSLSFNLRQNSNIGISYTMRISRPGISYLNPYVNQSDPTQVTYGNPDLDIEKTNNVSLVYNFFNQKLNLNATLTNAYTGNGIESYSFMEDGVMNTTYGNIVKRNNTSLSTFINWRPWNKTSFMLNGGVSYVNLKSHELNASNKGFQANMMVGVTQQFPYDIRGNVFLIMSTKTKSLQGWNSGFKMMAVNLSKSFFKDNLSINLGFNTGLNKGGKLLIENYIHTDTFNNKTTIKVPMMSFNLGVTLKFGSKTRVREVQSKHIENDYINQSSQMESISNSTSGAEVP